MPGNGVFARRSQSVLRRPRLEPDHLGRPQHFGNAELRRSQHMPEALALDRHAVKSSKNRESAEAGVNQL